MTEEREEPDQPQRRSARLMSLGTPLGIVVAIILLECLAVAVLLPSAEETQELGRELAAARVDGQDVTDEEPATGASADLPQLDLLEVDLGSYHIAVFQPSSNTTLRIDLHLYGIVLAKDLSDFELFYALHEHRLSEQVHATFRAAEVTDLTDAGLGLIKRRILEKSNRTLGKPLLQDVVFSKFSFLEQ
jgi:flagellar FliL protein